MPRARHDRDARPVEVDPIVGLQASRRCSAAPSTPIASISRSVPSLRRASWSAWDEGAPARGAPGRGRSRRGCPVDDIDGAGHVDACSRSRASPTARWTSTPTSPTSRGTATCGRASLTARGCDGWQARVAVGHLNRSRPHATRWTQPRVVRRLSCGRAGCPTTPPAHDFYLMGRGESWTRALGARRLLSGFAPSA